MSSFVEFAHPAWLAGGAIAVAAAELLRWRRGEARGLPFAYGRLLEGLPRSLRQRIARAIPSARLLLLLGIAVAAAGPTFAWQARRETRRAVDLLVLLDSSTSMTAALPGSFASTRFDAARAEARDFARGRPEDRVGLLAFARFPRLVVPLTWDHDLFESLLAEARPVVSGSDEDGTAIGVALAEAADELSSGTDHARAIVLVTDGVNTDDTIAPQDGMRLCAQRGVRIYAIALGVDADFGSGTPPPDPQLLRELAEATGGRSFVARDRAGLEEAWRAIGSLEPGIVATTAGLEAWPASSPLLAAALLAWLALGLLERAWTRSSP
jgi:Ca-activated chloride channel family protein